LSSLAKDTHRVPLLSGAVFGKWYTDAYETVKVSSANSPHETTRNAGEFIPRFPVFRFISCGYLLPFDLPTIVLSSNAGMSGNDKAVARPTAL
jgi:hypothetical protein